uniref:Gloverin n=1 Tax=Biston betularia TaxID=82595 RepID=A0A165QBC7_BISBE|nr:gloverin [Biston betularia]
MKHFLCLAVLIAYAAAQVSVSPDRELRYKFAKRVSRHPRDLTWDTSVGNNGKLFGTLGQDGNDLFGKAGYNHQIFDDGRGKLDAQAYGSRVLSPYGDSTKFGGGLNWADQNAKAGLDLSKSIGGHTALKATGEGLWHLNKNSELSAGGFYSQPFLGHGKSDYGVQAGYKLRF